MFVFVVCLVDGGDDIILVGWWVVCLGKSVRKFVEYGNVVVLALLRSVRRLSANGEAVRIPRSYFSVNYI